MEAEGQKRKRDNKNSTENEKPPIDEYSHYGRFGTQLFDDMYVPYLFRHEESYCSVDMVQRNIVDKYQMKLHPDLFTYCDFIRTHHITPTEARLLNNINHQHYEGHFGPKLYTVKDYLVNIEDVKSLCEYLGTCYKMCMKDKEPLKRCGYITIDQDFTVPYTIHNGEKYLPHFFFEGEAIDSNIKTETIDGWDLAYLRLCCRLQGINDAFYKIDQVAAISYGDVKGYFPTGTKFEELATSVVQDISVLDFERKDVKTFGWIKKSITVANRDVAKQLQEQQQHHQQQQQQQNVMRQRAVVAASAARFASKPGTNKNHQDQQSHSSQDNGALSTTNGDAEMYATLLAHHSAIRNRHNINPNNAMPPHHVI